MPALSQSKMLRKKGCGEIATEGINFGAVQLEMSTQGHQIIVGNLEVRTLG